MTRNLRPADLADSIEASIDNGFIYLIPRPATYRTKSIYVILQSDVRNPNVKYWHKTGISEDVDRRFGEIQGACGHKCTLELQIPLEGDVFGLENTVKKNLRKNLKKSEGYKWRGEHVKATTAEVVEAVQKTVKEIVRENRKALNADTRTKTKMLAQIAPEVQFVQTSIGVSFAK